MGDLLTVMGGCKRQRRARRHHPSSNSLASPSDNGAERDTALSPPGSHIQPRLPRRQGEGQTTGTTGNCVSAGRTGTDANQTEAQPAVQPATRCASFQTGWVSTGSSWALSGCVSEHNDVNAYFASNISSEQQCGLCPLTQLIAGLLEYSGDVSLLRTANSFWGT